ncbi:hypothetical protein GGR56DRAFT_679121 [Xylariaceae sp. FL0804]|nr:hypothetical protein GGR56DRAFT_679121 [Xylariaceae sp. FL0804]
MYHIIDWLRECQQHERDDHEHDDHSAQNPRKRRRTAYSEAFPPTPDLSAVSMDSDHERTPQAKRHKPLASHTQPSASGQLDGKLNLAPVASPRSQPDIYSDEQSTDTSISRRSSPTKRRRELEVEEENPVRVLSIDPDDDRIPSPLTNMLEVLESFSEGDKVVPRSLRNVVKDRQAKADDTTGAWRSRKFANFKDRNFNDERDEGFWPYITLEDVIKIVKKTNMCINDMHSEHGWNTMVHFDIFELALGEGVEIPIPPTNAGRTTSSTTPSTTPSTIPSTTADTTQSTTQSTAQSTTQSTTPDKIPDPTANRQPERVHVCALPIATARIIGSTRGSKMVDFCLAIQPRTPESVLALDNMRRLTTTINHTNYYPLRDKLLVLSAESKKPGAGGEEAKNQVGIWQAAQWALLQKQQQVRQLQSSAAVAAAAGSEMMTFLPGLLIQGETWHFVATTRLDNLTILWHQQLLGSSNTTLGVFKIVSALRHLAKWSATQYWPWYRDNILAYYDKAT